MPRPPLGSSAKTVVASVRLTTAEEQMLITRYGSASRALRVLVDTVAPVATHRHRRGIVVDTEWKDGSAHSIYACAEPGCTHRLR